MKTPSLLTAADVARISLPGEQVELVRGQLVVRQDTGFKIASDPATVRAPDVAFVGRERAGGVRRRPGDVRPVTIAARWQVDSVLEARSGVGEPLRERPRFRALLGKH